MIYFLGVDNDRFQGTPIKALTVTAVNSTAEEEEFNAREAVFESHRAELQFQFRLMKFKLFFVF